MADVAPFRGLRYNLKKTPDPSQVVIPPYDVISPQEQELFYQLNPYNMIRIELGKRLSGDSQTENAHTRAARFLEEWRKEEVIIRDEEPAIYYYELDYPMPGEPMQTRCGFICILRLEEFAAGGVRPHEKTFQKVKDERLGLMLSCQANLSPVFALYSDPPQSVDDTLRSGRKSGPVLAFKDRNGMEHRIWRVTDIDTLQKVRILMMDKEIFIADGHHRYETALSYRNLQRQSHPQAGPNASFEYIMMYLSNMHQHGMTILPTHRLLRHIDPWNPEAFLAQARELFEIESYGTAETGKAAWKAGLEVGRAKKENVIGFYCERADAFHLLQARPDKVESYLAQLGMAESLRNLDVVVLDQIVLRRILKLSDAFLGSADNIHFKHDLDEALSEVRQGSYQAAFCINPTRMEQVQEVATAGLIMPHKSTYFYPKVGSGTVIHLLRAGEQAIW